MGTRADYYIGRGKTAEWLGSTPWDGYPDGTPAPLEGLKTEEEFRAAVAKILEENKGTTPDMGWPWPWEDSNITDYAYAFDEGQVWVHGNKWRTWKEEINRDEDEEYVRANTEFPNMKDRQNVTLGPRSGLIVIESRDGAGA